MKATLLGRYDPNTPEWDDLRSRGLGGSEIAAVVGLSPWVSRFALWHRKRGTIGKQEVNVGMDWGHRLEDVVCQAWAERRDMLNVHKGGTYRNNDRPWQLANPDRLLSDDEHDEPIGFLEAKTAHQYDAHEWGTGPEDIPPYYRCQVLWYMDVLEVPEAHLAVLIGGSDYREYVIPYAAAEAEWLRAEGEKFWHEVRAGIAPDIDGHDATYKAVRELHPEIDGETVALDPDLHEWFTTSKQAAEQTKAEHQAAKATVLDAMGQAQYAEVNGERVYRRQPGRGGSVSLYPVPPFRPENDQKEKSA